MYPAFWELCGKHQPNVILNGSNTPIVTILKETLKFCCFFFVVVVLFVFVVFSVEGVGQQQHLCTV